VDGNFHLIVWIAEFY